MKGVNAVYDDLDIIIVRENEHGMYSGEGQTLSDDGSAPRRVRSSRAIRARASSLSPSSWRAPAGAKSHAVAQGQYPEDITGQNIANPISVLRAIAMLFDHLDDQTRPTGFAKPYARRSPITAHDRVTPDLDGDGTTDGFTQAVIERL